jgi:hypothetical protein
MEKKYAVYPMHITSASDGGMHYIGFRQLCRLYGVAPCECIDMSRAPFLSGIDASSLIELYPTNGEYKIPASIDGEERS